MSKCDEQHDVRYVILREATSPNRKRRWWISLTPAIEAFDEEEAIELAEGEARGAPVGARYMVAKVTFITAVKRLVTTTREG